MKLETALKGAVAIPKGFHSSQGRKLIKKLKSEFHAGKDVHGQKFTPLSAQYKKKKKALGKGGKADMKLSGQLLNSKYFKKISFINKNSWKATTGSGLAGTKALAHSNKIPMPKGLPIRAIVGDGIEDDVVHPRLKKEFMKAYSKRVFGHLKKIPKKEFL